MNGQARAPRKEGPSALVRDDFELSEVVDSPVILVDGVFRSGTSLESAARATRRAGATVVLTLTAVRTPSS
jgi:predicted amidophosphoribosyltransferase